MGFIFSAKNKMNWYNRIKLASVQYLYHGTGSQNLSSIMSQGLNEDHDLLYDNDLSINSIRSYGGIYLTDNIMTACSSGRKSSRKEEGRESGPVRGWTLVGVKIESRTPHITIDEDQFYDPYIVSKEFAYSGNANPYNIAHYLSNKLESDIPAIVDRYLSFYKESKGIQDDNFINGIKQYIPELIRASLLRVLSKNMSGLYYDDYSSRSNREKFEADFPQFAGLNEAEVENNYRTVSNFVMEKANRLTEFTEKNWQTNVRSSEPISFRGKNKIIMICNVVEREIGAPYHEEFNITYLSDKEIIQQLVADATEKFGQHIIVTYNGTVFYEKKKEEKAANGNWYKQANFDLVFDHIHEDFHNDQHDYVLAAKDASTMQPVGMIQYALFRYNIHIQDMLVKQDLRRQSIGTQMINEIKREYPTSRINWGMMTPNGSSLYESMENPTNELV